MEHNLLKWKKIFQDSNIFLYTLHDGFQKYLKGKCTLEVARNHVQFLHNQDSEVFPFGCVGTSVSTLITQVLYPVYKVPELHLQCSNCDYKFNINTNRISRIIYVDSHATGSTAQILENYMQYHIEQNCANCNAPLENMVHFNDPHKIFVFDVTDRNVTLSRNVKILGSTRSTILHLKGLVYYGSFHFTC